jgi:RNA ligase (TIGR02306 family)
MSSLIVKIVKVYNVIKHPNADRLSIVTVDSENGWNCIVGLDQYKVGDLVTFVPPDCIIPNDLIEKHELTYLKTNGRTGTVKLRGFISQGLILPVPAGKKLGDDVADVLGITKYEPPQASYVANTGTKPTSKKKLNPLFDKYTDIENIKHYGDVFEEGESVIITEKLHGTNSRFSRLEIALMGHANIFQKISYFFRKYVLGHKQEFVYGSHNVQISGHSGRKSFYGDDVWGAIAKKYNLANVIPDDTIVYGEIVGEGIQDLTYGLKGHDFYVFDIKQNGKYLNYYDAHYLAKKMGLNFVPFLYAGDFNAETVKHLTEGKSMICPSQIREGCIIKPLSEENDIKIGRKILKSISPEYLTRKGGTEYS